MWSSLSGLKAFVRLGSRQSESTAFFLHYRLTALALLFCSALLSAASFHSSRIQCLSRTQAGVSTELLNAYCWAASTYSTYTPQAPGATPHPGVSALGSRREWRNYYQYTPIVLLLAAVLFYAPHLLWKALQGRFGAHLAALAARAHPNGVPGDPGLDQMAAYIADRWGTRQPLFLKYLLCESACLLNCAAQCALLHQLFGGRPLGLDLWSGADPDTLFPLVTVCTFRRYGPSGHVDLLDSLCVLPNNALNAKIFMAFWLWLPLLLLLSALHLGRLLLAACAPACRRTGCGRLDAGAGDWFVLAAVRRELDPLLYKRLLEALAERLCTLETEANELA